MIQLLVLLLAFNAHAQNSDELYEKLTPYRKQLTAKKGCPDLKITGGVAHVEGRSGSLQVGIYKSKLDIVRDKTTSNSKQFNALGPPNEECLEATYYPKFDILIYRINKGETNGFSEFALNIVKVEDGKPVSIIEKILMNYDEDGDSNIFLTPRIVEREGRLILTLKNRLEDQPEQIIDISKKE